MDTIPGSDTLGFGFDILKLYDKSSTTSQVFKSGQPDARQQTIGGTVYLVPENISFEPDRDKNGDSRVFSTRQQVQDHFSVKAGVTGSGFGFKGHFDMSYSKVANSDKSYYYALVEAWDRSYTLKLRNQGKSWLDDDFAEEMNALPAEFSRGNQDEFFSFFGKYGTHFVHQVRLGGHMYYYVSIEKSFSSNETTIKANMDMEYKGVFGKVKADAESSWRQLGKDWAKSRIVSLHAQGGETGILDSLEPGFGEWKGDSFSEWSQSLASKPGVTGFNLRPVSELVPASKRTVVSKALTEYLKGGIIVNADRDATPNKRQEFTAYPTIIGVDGLVKPTSPAPMPERPNLDVAGIQVVLFEPDTHKVFLNRVYYVTPPMPDKVRSMYRDLMADIDKVTATDYYCAVSVFGLYSSYYPPTEVVGWLSECGAQLTAWKNYMGLTSSGQGIICYSFAGRKGARIGVREDFRIDHTLKLNKLNSSTMYFLHGGGLQAKAKG